MTTAFQALVETTKFFELNPDKFITGNLAQDANGDSVHPSSPQADCFCTVGYMAKLLGVPPSTSDDRAYTVVEEAIDYDDHDLPSKGTLVEQNDNIADAGAVVAKLKEQLADA